MTPAAVVKLMSDYGCGWPLWPLSPNLDASADALDLSHDLTVRLLALEQLFESGFHYQRGWLCPDDEARYAREAVDCWYRLGQELDGRGIEVVADLWPVNDPELRRWLVHRGITRPTTT